MPGSFSSSSGPGCVARSACASRAFASTPGSCARAALTASLAADERRRKHLHDEARRALRAIEQELALWGKPLAQLVRASLALLNGRSEAAIDAFAAAEEGFRSHEMHLLERVARRRRGQLIGGGEGAALVESTTAWMQAEGIVAPDRLAALFAPAPG
jgi:membrane protein required for beta-lactamase induction